MSTNLNEILSIMCPLKFKNIFINKPDWLTQDIMELMNHRNHYVKLSNERGAEIYFRLSRFLRNKCNKVVNAAKGRFIQDKLNENRKHPKRFWREINCLLSSKKDNDSRHQLINPDTGDLCAVGTESDVINYHYANVGSIILRNHDGIEPWDFGTARHNNVNGIVFDEIVDGELEFILKDIDVGKSSGIEYISSNVLKICFVSLLSRLKHIYNCSLQLGRFPATWAHGTITPTPKCGDTKLVGNWRPIALVPLPGKVMEKLVHKRLLDIILDLDILTSNQYGFVPGRSTSQAVFRLYKDLSTSMNNGNLTGLLYIDLSKAFDSIHHGRLLNKLSMLGLDSLAVSWLESYLTRTQTTFFNGNMSGKITVSSGVPQGSVLGPLLFILYINDICDVIEHCNIILYADDCVLYTSHRKSTVVQAILQSDASKLANWCNINLLSINVRKTKTMLVGTRQKLAVTQPLEISLNNAVLESVISYNYLGLILDCELSLTQHLSEVHDRVQRKLFHLRKIRKYLNQFASTQVYKQTILPLLDYCGFLAMSGNKNCFTSLQILQNDALRACVGYPDGYNMSRIDLHARVNLSSVFQRWDKQLLLLMYDEARIDDNVIEPVRVTRQSLKLNLRQYKMHNKKYINSPFIRGKHLWDRLPHDTQLLVTKFEFKEKLKPIFAKYDEKYLEQ